MSDRLHCPGCGIPTIEGGVDTTEEELYCNRCVEELERNMNTNKPVGGAQFTPGPWSAYNAKNGVIYKHWRVNTGTGLILLDDAAHWEAGNATLIAAAPAMYAELVAGLVLLEASYQDMCGKYGTDSLHAQTVWERVERTRQVIAQAEGRHHE